MLVHNQCPSHLIPDGLSLVKWKKITEISAVMVNITNAQSQTEPGAEATERPEKQK